MTKFLTTSPTLDANWRAVVLFGRNVASCKFAPTKSLLEMARLRSGSRCSEKEHA